MGRTDVNLDDDIKEINEHASAIAKAAKRKERYIAIANTPSGPDQEADTPHDENITKIGANQEIASRDPEMTEPTSLAVIPPTSAKPKTNRLKPSQSKSSPQSDVAPSSADDPWTTDTIKIRHSKKLRLEELWLSRKLKKLTPFQKQDLLDDALTYIFEKYSVD